MCDGFDPGLAGFWPVGAVAVYAGDAGDAGDVGDGGWGDLAGGLETKAEAAPVEEMQGLLNAMSGELRAQFAMFQRIREQAELRLDGEEAEAKIAKADAKAAVDALSLIIRTMEKIDGLQRGLADALARQAEETFDDAAYRKLLADIDRKISERAEERAHRLLADRAAIAAGDTGPPEGTQGSLAADAAAGG